MSSDQVLFINQKGNKGKRLMSVIISGTCKHRGNIFGGHCHFQFQGVQVFG